MCVFIEVCKLLRACDLRCVRRDGGGALVGVTPRNEYSDNEQEGARPDRRLLSSPVSAHTSNVGSVTRPVIGAETGSDLRVGTE